MITVTDSFIRRIVVHVWRSPIRQRDLRHRHLVSILLAHTMLRLPLPLITARSVTLAHSLTSFSTTPSTPSPSSRIKVYTKTGDKGKSSLFTGERRGKDDPVFEALGAVDEVSAVLSCAREAEYGMAVELSSQIIEIQSRLIDVGSNIATPSQNANEARLRRVAFSSTHVEELEAWIDEMDTQLPELRNFILPSGGMSASLLHLARATTRRAERLIVPLVKAGDVAPEVGVYVNRLSDYLFQAARLVALREGKPEMVYKKAKEDLPTQQPSSSASE